MMTADAPAKTFRLVGRDGVVFNSPGKGLFGGNRRTKVFGRLDCPTALRYLARGTYAKNRVFFACEDDATAAGYRPCRHCMERRPVDANEQSLT